MVETQDDLCALPYDTYTVEELRCSGNQGYDLVRVEHVTISRDNTTIYLGTLDDQFEGVPEIGTTALVDGEHTAAPSGEVTIVDEVAYKNLKVGQTYKLSGVLMDKETGEPPSRWRGGGTGPGYSRGRVHAPPAPRAQWN